MTRTTFIILLLVAASAIGATMLWARPAKVDVCHIPPGNPANAHVINVSENALAAHIAHGDSLDLTPCQESPGAPG